MEMTFEGFQDLNENDMLMVDGGWGALVIIAGIAVAGAAAYGAGYAIGKAYAHFRS